MLVISDIPLLKELLEETKQQMFHDFVFEKDNLIHALQRAGYLTIRRSTLWMMLEPLASVITSASVPTGRVWVSYDFQVDSSLPFEFLVAVYFDNHLWVGHAGMPATWKWKIIGWDDFHDNITISAFNRSPVDDAYFSLIGRFLEFEKKHWEEFKENFLHPLEYYAKGIMERKL